MRSEVWAFAHPSVMGSLQTYWSLNGWHPQNNSDPVFDEYFENAAAATTIEE